MEPSAVTPSRFRQLAEAYGAEIARWPAAERDGAYTLEATDPECEAMLNNELALDRLLGTSPGAVPSRALEDAIIASAPRARRVQHRSPIKWGARLAAAGVVGAVICGTGIVAGFATAHVAAEHMRVEAASDPAAEAGRWLGEPVDAVES